MKKLFFSIFALCVGLYAVTQSSVYFYQKDGKTLEFPVSNLDSISFTKPTTGTENGYTWVDLGLSVRWATMNVGATAPEEYGNYYAWGEIATKNTYSWSNYTLADGSESTLTKYCCNSSYGKDGFTDGLTTLTAADDAATQNWGSNWRMPTIDEWQELLDNCTWTWTTLNSVEGYEVKATNGNSIFLPAAGFRGSGELDLAGSNGFYWSSSLVAGSPYFAQFVGFYSGNHGTGYGTRDCGQSVRAVVGK